MKNAVRRPHFISDKVIFFFIRTYISDFYQANTTPISFSTLAISLSFRFITISTFDPDRDLNKEINSSNFKDVALLSFLTIDDPVCLIEYAEWNKDSETFSQNCQQSIYFQDIENGFLLTENKK